jgi:hypothetical protein
VGMARELPASELTPRRGRAYKAMIRRRRDRVLTDGNAGRVRRTVSGRDRQRADFGSLGRSYGRDTRPRPGYLNP